MTRKKSLVALSLLVASFMGLLLISCDQQSPQHGSQDKGGTLDGEAGRSTYLFSGILKTPDLTVKANNGNGYELGLYMGLSYGGALVDKLSIPELQRLWDYIYQQHIIK